jgi:F0F1-type ATP synthase alpha subunit
MAEIRPEEISSILREQLSQSRTDAQLQEVGTVLTVGDGVARIYGLTKAQAGELIEFENGLKALVQPRRRQCRSGVVGRIKRNQRRRYRKTYGPNCLYQSR